MDSRQPSPTLATCFSDFLKEKSPENLPSTESISLPLPKKLNIPVHSHPAPASSRPLWDAHCDWPHHHHVRRKKEHREKKKSESRQKWSMTGILWLTGGILVSVLLVAHLLDCYLSQDWITEPDEEEEQEAQGDQKQREDKKEQEKRPSVNKLRQLPSEKVAVLCQEKRAGNELLRRIQFWETCAKKNKFLLE